MTMPFWLKTIVDVLSTPAIVIGIVALIGLLVQKKSAADVILGTLNSLMGVLIVSGGASVLVGGMSPLSGLFTQAFNIKGYYGQPETATAMILPALGTEIGLIMALGFLLHTILARILPWESTKQLYLTGHIMWSQAGVAALALYGYQLSGMPAIIIGSVFHAVYLTLSCAMAWIWIKKVTKGEFGFGHFQSSTVALVGFFSKLGDPKNDAEKLTLPGWLKIFKNPAIIGMLTILGTYLVPILVIGPAAVEAQYTGGKNFLVYSFIQASTFGAGIQIILLGVRMFVAEIIPAFKGIGDKIIPGAKPALDCPAIYPFSPVASVIGVIAFLIGEFIGMLLQIMLTPDFVFVINAVPIFFVGSSMGVIGNVHGGVRGAIICGFAAPLVWRLGFMPAIHMFSIETLALGPAGLDIMKNGILLGGGDNIWIILYSLLLSVFGFKPIGT